MLIYTAFWENLTGSTDPGQSGPAIYGSEGILHIPPRFRIGASLSDAV